METTDANSIIKNRLKAFKEIAKNTALVSKERKSASKSHQRWISKTIHDPLIAQGKCIDEYSLREFYESRGIRVFSEIQKNWNELRSKFITHQIEYLRGFSAREIHFAYSIVRGRCPEEIEQKVATGNEINLRNVDLILTATMGLIDFFGESDVPMLDDVEINKFRTAIKDKCGWELNNIRNKVFSMKSITAMRFARK